MQERGETWAVDPEMREALDRLTADVRGEIHASSTSLRQQLSELFHEFESGIRRDFDAMAESLRGDIRALAESMVASLEQTDRRR